MRQADLIPMHQADRAILRIAARQDPRPTHPMAVRRLPIHRTLVVRDLADQAHILERAATAPMAARVQLSGRRAPQTDRRAQRQAAAAELA